MNNYVLVTKRNESSNYVIDSSNDDLEALSKRFEQLISRGNLENKIFQLSNLSTGKEYVDDRIEFIARSMVKFQFYPIYRIRTEIKGLDKITLTTYFMSERLILSNEDFKDVIDELNLSLVETFNKVKISEYVKDLDLSNPDIYNHKYKLIGMDSWVVDPIGCYYTLNSNLSHDKLIESFKDYVNRHKGITMKFNDKDDENPSLTSMDYSKFPNRRVEDFPVSNRYIGRETEVKFIRINNAIRIYLND